MDTTPLYKALLEANVSEKTAERVVEVLAFADYIATTTNINDLETAIAKLTDAKEKATTTTDIASLAYVIARLEDRLKELKELEKKLDNEGMEI